MPDSGEFTKDAHSAQYIEDAFKERLPKNWSVARSEGNSYDNGQSKSAFYTWTNWNDANYCTIEVNEWFANKVGVDALCDFVMLQVEEVMQDPFAKWTTPRWKRGLVPIPREVLIKMAEDEQNAMNTAQAEYERTH